MSGRDLPPSDESARPIPLNDDDEVSLDELVRVLAGGISIKSRSQVNPTNGRVIEEPSTGDVYIGNGTSWIDAADALGLTSNGVTADVIGQDAVNITERYLAADGSADDAANLQDAVESEEGRTLVLEEESGVINIDSQVAPSTTGERTVIDCLGNPTIDIAGTSATEILDFISSDNVTILGPVTIKGENKDSTEFGLRAGAGFRFVDLTFDTGAGGLKISGDVSDIRGQGLYVSDQHDTTNGHAAALDTIDCNDVYLSNIRAINCDRGMEVEDGTVNLTAENGYLEDIDNSQASSPGADFVLSVHNHDSVSEVKDVTYRDWRVNNCPGAGIKATQNGPQMRGILFEDITLLESGRPQVYCDDLTLRDIRADYTNIDPNQAITIGGGESIIIDGFLVRELGWGDFVRLTSPPNINHGSVVIRDLKIDEATTGGIDSVLNIQSDANVEHVTLENYDPGPLSNSSDGPRNEGITISSGGLDTSVTGYGAEVRDVYMVTDQDSDPAIDVNTSNPPILVVGGSKRPASSISAPAGSRIESMSGADVADANEGVVVDGLVQESGTSDTPSGTNANPGDHVDYDDTDDDTGDGVWIKRADGTMAQLI